MMFPGGPTLPKHCEFCSRPAVDLAQTRCRLHLRDTHELRAAKVRARVQRSIERNRERAAAAHADAHRGKRPALRLVKGGRGE
jgi:hypothetical protein